jgi:hypothetical protein
MRARVLSYFESVRAGSAHALLQWNFFEKRRDRDRIRAALHAAAAAPNQHTPLTIFVIA